MPKKLYVLIEEVGSQASLFCESWKDELDDVYEQWKRWTNMSASQLRRWSANPISRKASVDPSAVIRRNLHLLETPKPEWGAKEVQDAKRTISYNQRGSGDDQGKPIREGIPFSKRDIALLNWAYRPSSVSSDKLSYWCSASGIKKAEEILGTRAKEIA